jgi:hypothetical protein
MTPKGDVRDLGFHLKWNMGFTYDAVSLFGADFDQRPQLETFGWKRLAWSLGAVSPLHGEFSEFYDFPNVWGDEHHEHPLAG